MKKIVLVLAVVLTSVSLFAQPNHRGNAHQAQQRKVGACKIDKCANFEKMMKFYDVESFSLEQKKQMESLVKLYSQHSAKIVKEIQGTKKELEVLMGKAIVDDKAFESIINDIDSLVVKQRRLVNSFRKVSSLFVNEDQIVKPQRQNMKNNCTKEGKHIHSNQRAPEGRIGNR